MLVIDIPVSVAQRSCMQSARPVISCVSRAEPAARLLLASWVGRGEVTGYEDGKGALVHGDGWCAVLLVKLLVIRCCDVVTKPR